MYIYIYINTIHIAFGTKVYFFEEVALFQCVGVVDLMLKFSNFCWKNGMKHHLLAIITITQVMLDFSLKVD